jgi:hypothetical protein
MVNFLAKYIPNESTITAPLRELLKSDAVWDWQHEHDSALNKLKHLLTSGPVLQFYDVHKPVTIQTDASQFGLGSSLIQGGRPVAYASRALTNAEQNYAQIEKEMLAICFSCEKFHQYIYGKQVLIESDHRPLETILKKPIAKAPPRLQRMMLRLQRYDLIVRYTPGKYMYLADTLSRVVLTDVPDMELLEDMEVMVHSLVECLPVSSTKLADIKKATLDDQSLHVLHRTIKSGWPKSNKSSPSRRIGALETKFMKQMVYYSLVIA